MTQDVTRLMGGLVITDDNLVDSAGVITGTAAPGGDGGRQDNAVIGTTYLQSLADASLLQQWSKVAFGANDITDWARIATQDYVDGLVGGIASSNREPALVADGTNYASIPAAVTAANVADTVDGVLITPGARLLFTDLTAGNENVYIVSGVSGAWIFTEDTNLATDGDSVRIQEGTDAEGLYVFDGTQWILDGLAVDNELEDIRNFIGKDAVGIEAPVYTSADVVTQNDTLEQAIGQLDAAVSILVDDNETTKVANVTAITTVASVIAADTEVVVWRVSVEDVTNTLDRRTAMVHATHNGVDAPAFSVNDILSLGGAIPGLTVTVDLVGGSMRLRISSTLGVDVSAKRITTDTYN